MQFLLIHTTFSIRKYKTFCFSIYTIYCQVLRNIISLNEILFLNIKPMSIITMHELHIFIKIIKWFILHVSTKDFNKVIE